MYVKTVDLVNVKGFEKLQFDFTRPDGTFHGWTVVVGGNASGKSTLLKAMALALVGSPAIYKLTGSEAGWLKGGAASAEAEITLAWDAEVDQFLEGSQVDLTSVVKADVHWEATGEQRSPGGVIMGWGCLTPASPRQHPSTVGHKVEVPLLNGPWNPSLSGWFSAGYGPMRRLSGSSLDAARDSETGGPLVSRFITLFREEAALSESEAWLKLNYARHLESGDPHLQVLLSGVQGLLNDGLLPHGMKIARITVDHVYIRDHLGIELPMRDISDGCRSVYAMVLDLVRGMAEAYGTQGLFVTQDDGRVVVGRPGVVLIDEIEVHLHPQWQSDISEWFKAHFAHVQFIVSTHSALVAQAADPNGVFVLPSQGDPGRVPRQLDPREYELLRLRRAEKTLLGSAFGLKTTRSKWALDQIERWKRLDAKARAGVPLTAQERSDLSRLKAQMEVAFSESMPGESGAAAP